MMTQNADKKREQIQMFCMDDLVPQDHLLRLIDQAIDWSFIYDLVIDKYSADNGRPSMDPVMLIKIPFIQYLYGIRSMRQTVKEIEVNVAYRWFLGLERMEMCIRDSPEAATDYYYKLSRDSDYIRRYRICKDMKWVAPTKYGDLDITF